MENCVQKFSGVPHAPELCSKDRAALDIPAAGDHAAFNPARYGVPAYPSDPETTFTFAADAGFFTSKMYCYFLYRGFFDPAQLKPVDLKFYGAGTALLKEESEGYSAWLTSKAGQDCQRAVIAAVPNANFDLAPLFQSKTSALLLNPLGSLVRVDDVASARIDMQTTLNHERIHILQQRCPALDQVAKRRWKAKTADELATYESSHPEYKWEDADVGNREALAFDFEKDPFALFDQVPSCFKVRGEPVHVAVYDIAVPSEDINKAIGVKLSGHSVNFLPAFNEQAGCGARLGKIERILEPMITGEVDPNDDSASADSLESTLYRAHPFHLISLITQGEKNLDVALFGSHDPDPTEEKASGAYESRVHAEFAKFRGFLKSFRPDLVNYSQSDSLEEIENDIRSTGVKEKEVKSSSEKVYRALAREWIATLQEFPEIFFVVSAGNGGVKGLGLIVAPYAESGGEPVPASLTAPNLIVVGSFHADKGSFCPARFSNRGALVGVFAAGERVESSSGCAERTRVKLSGTSQSTALVTRYLARELRSGHAPDYALSRLTTSACGNRKMRLLKD